jgi:23S rRNA (cytidine2498-2'-O)-methyltransferase
MTFTGYVAAPHLEEELKEELQGPTEQYGRLFIVPDAPQKVHWAQNIWYDPIRISFRSISDAAKQLRSLHHLWAFYPTQWIRRGALITQQLPYFAPKPLPFPSPLPSSALGSWTLIDANTLIASPRCSSPFAHGEVHFQESLVPPGRAYLKLWEFFTRIGHFPQAGAKCLDLGASPGSWTWVLQQLGAQVLAVDRAPLDPMIAKLPGVSFLKKDAFSTSPEELNGIDWVFCDVVCFPKKLLRWLQTCLAFHPTLNFVCTIKFQGKADSNIIREFERIEGSSCLHLFHNKHELTWSRLPNCSL